jgi:RNA polymerase sigma-70 factor (ECF subfamily)
VDDAALAARIADGDERAIETLSERFGASMRSVAMRVTRSERVAEEVVQDALMAIWRDPGRYDPSRGSLGPWLLTLTRYKAIDAVRREAAIQRRTADVDLELREAPDDVHNEVWLGIRRERLREAIATLGAEQRRALELAFISGLTHIEVAEREGIPLGTAKTRIRSALLKLRDQLGASLSADDSPRSATGPSGNRGGGSPGHGQPTVQANRQGQPIRRGAVPELKAFARSWFAALRPVPPRATYLLEANLHG